MPLKPLRRLAPVQAPSLHDEITQHALSTSPGRRQLEQVEREHPELILRREGNVLAVADGGSLAYGFRSESAFVDEFPAMFEQLLRRMRRLAGADTVRFRLTHNPARPVVEPVLKRLWFSSRRSWLGFSLEKGAGPRPGAVPGVRFREGGAADLDALARLDREAFPDTPMPREAIRARLEQGARVLIAEAGGEAAGDAIFEPDEDGRAYLSVLAVAEAMRGRGIGAALTARVARMAFAEGALALDLKTEDDNAAAIRLYRRLGFRPSYAGRDYSRPTDPRAISRIRQTSEGTVIRFGGWR